MKYKCLNGNIAKPNLSFVLNDLFNSFSEFKGWVVSWFLCFVFINGLQLYNKITLPNLDLFRTVKTSYMNNAIRLS